MPARSMPRPEAARAARSRAKQDTQERETRPPVAASPRPPSTAGTGPARHIPRGPPRTVAGVFGFFGGSKRARGPRRFPSYPRLTKGRGPAGHFPTFPGALRERAARPARRARHRGWPRSRRVSQQVHKRYRGVRQEYGGGRGSGMPPRREIRARGALQEVSFFDTLRLPITSGDLARPMSSRTSHVRTTLRWRSHCL